jgi:signal transduction histidine kinase
MTDFEELDSEDDLREAVSSVYHDLNNPLSIISGNAQFLLELSREQGLDEQFESSARDIQEASQRMSESLQRLTRLRDSLGDQDLEDQGQ